MPNISAATLAHWFGVLTTGGLHYLLNLPADKMMDRARIDAAVHLFAGGWRTPVAPSPAPLVEQTGTEVAPSNPGRTLPARWDDLLRHTARALLDEGVRHTSVDQLAAMSGLSKMTIYRRYGDKNGLIAAALDRLVDDLTADRAIAAPHDDLTAMLTIAARDHHHRFARPDNLALLRLMVGEATHRPVLVTRLWDRLATPGLDCLSAALAARCETGEIHLTDPRAAAEQFLLLAAEGNRLLTGSRAWSDDERYSHITQLVNFFLRAALLRN